MCVCVSVSFRLFVSRALMAGNVCVCVFAAFSYLFRISHVFFAFAFDAPNSLSNTCTVSQSARSIGLISVCVCVTDWVERVRVSARQRRRIFFEHCPIL